MKKIYGVFIAVLMFMAMSLNVSAEEKEMVVPLEKKYPEVVFYFEFGDGQEHMIYITKPDGEIINQVSTSATASLSVIEAMAGEYKILIEADEEIVVKSRVECKNSTASEGSSVTVSSALAGLEVFFMNGDLHVEWQDTGVGDVNIKVTSPKTMQVIAEEKVSGTSYVVPINDAVNNIEVFIIPAAYSRLEGAGIGYTLEVVRDVGATVNLPTYTVTNQSTISIPVVFTQQISVVTEVNEEMLPEQTYEAGEHEIEVPITGTNNDIILYFIDSKGNINYHTFSIGQDIIAPSLSLNGSYDGYVTEYPSVIISGYVNDAKTLYVNNTEITFDAYGRFECEYPLEMGANSIIIRGCDEAGNEVLSTINITRQEAQKDNSTIILLVIAVLVILVVLFILKKRNNKNDGLYNEKNDKSPSATSFKPESPAKVKNKKVKEKKEKPIKEKNKTENCFKSIGENLHIKEIKSKIEVDKEATSTTGERRERMRKKKFITEVVVSCVQIGVFAIFLLFVVRNTVVSSGSMEPTLMTKDIVIFNRLAYTFSSVERGDIINFWSEEYGKLFSKRVIGVAGDEIEFHDGFVFINGQQCDESAYIEEGIETNCTKTFVVPEGTVFVMGDNRENSIDSRFFVNPYIPLEDIEGKYLGTIPWIFD